MNIRRLRLPDKIPDQATLDSFKGHEFDYNPNFWELGYHAGRYLQDAPIDDLRIRYNDILRNMRTLVSDEGAVKPLNWIDSSWYWFKKEHQTRMEFELRSENLPCEPPWTTQFNNTYIDAPLRPKHFNAGDVLFRFCKHKYLYQLLKDGHLRLRPASDYASIENDKARQDDETCKATLHGASHVRVTAESGQSISIIGDLRLSTTAPDYYTFCLSSDWDSDLYKEFQGSDSCLVIRDARSFIERVRASSRIELPGWQLFAAPIHYYDPYTPSRAAPILPAMSKDFRYAYQREFRLIWMPPATESPQGCRFIQIGSIEDIAFLRPR